MSLPPVIAPIILGNDLSTLVETQGSGAIQFRALALSTSPTAIYGEETVTQTFTALTQGIQSLIPQLNSQHPTELQCYLKEVDIRPANATESNVTLVYRTELTSTSLSVDETVCEMDIGVMAQPIELNNYFSTLQDSAFVAVQTKIDDPSASVSLSTLAQQLYEFRLKGVESTYVPMPIFRISTGKKMPSFNFGNIGKLEYPTPLPTGVTGPPGAQHNWLKTNYRVSKHGGVYAQVHEWSYSKDGWDMNLYVSA